MSIKLVPAAAVGLLPNATQIAPSVEIIQYSSTTAEIELCCEVPDEVIAVAPRPSLRNPGTPSPAR
jgi:hypothetical protein